MECKEIQCKKTLNKRQKLFCSKACYIRYRKRNATYSGNRSTVDKKCKECNRLFAAPKVELKRNHAQFCSRSCATTHRNRILQYRDPNEECANCGKVLYRKPSQRAKHNIFFCNIRCQREWRRSHKWHRTHNRPSNWKRLSQRIKEKRGNKCEICGWEKAYCDAAHIIPRSEGGKDQEENIIVLCPNHHRILDVKGSDAINIS